MYITQFTVNLLQYHSFLLYFYCFFFLKFKVYSRSITILHLIFSNIVSPSEVYYSIANITQMSYFSYTDLQTYFKISKLTYIDLYQLKQLQNTKINHSLSSQTVKHIPTLHHRYAQNIFINE